MNLQLWLNIESSWKFGFYLICMCSYVRRIKYKGVDRHNRLNHRPERSLWREKARLSNRLVIGAYYELNKLKLFM